MRFEFAVALKYLIPRWRQLSVSIISLLSVLVISLVVWLVLLFLSVTEGIEKKWIQELISFNAPIKLTPKDAYFHSYFYQIDPYSLASNYTSKSIGEKLLASRSDPYDPESDSELPLNFPAPQLNADGSLKDPVKEAWDAILTLQEKNIRPQEYEVTFGNLHLNIFQGDTASYVSQVSYVCSLDAENHKMKKQLLPLTVADFQNVLSTIYHAEDSPQKKHQNLRAFFSNLTVKKLKTGAGFALPRALYPVAGDFKGVGIVKEGKIESLVLPQSVEMLADLEKRLHAQGYETRCLNLHFNNGHLATSEEFVSSQLKIFLDEKIPFHAKLLQASLDSANSLETLEFSILSQIQNVSLCGTIPFKGLEIAEIEALSLSALEPFWIFETEGKCKMPSDPALGEGILVSKHFKKSGVQLGTTGVLSYYSPTTSSLQEQRLAVFVAGFYDPGMLPLGNKLLFVSPKVTAQLRSNLTVSDNMIGNGINVWLDDLEKAETVKAKLIHALEKRNVAQYWNVESYHDYEFSKPILQQLKSDKNLFTLIAVIILIVACSNIISMLILLVNDKKKEIGILQSMGASPLRIAAIFGICGFTTGFISSILGTVGAFYTLKHLHAIINLLSFLQGHEVFHAAFYGQEIPNQMSYGALTFVTIATLIISLLAGIIPAIKAARIRPSEILRAE